MIQRIFLNLLLTWQVFFYILLNIGVTEMHKVIKTPSWVKNFLKRRPVKLLGSVNIHVYAVVEAIAWLAYSSFIHERVGFVTSILGMVALGLVFHAVWYAKEAICILNDHSIYDGNGPISFKVKLKEFVLAIVHKPTIPDYEWPLNIDLRIWYPAVYRFVWFGFSIAYVIYQYRKDIMLF